MNRISTFLDKKGWSIYKLSQMSGHPRHRTKTLVESPTIPPNARLSTLQKIASAFNTSLDELAGPAQQGIKIIIPGEVPPTWNNFYSGKIKHWQRAELAADIHQIVRAHLDPDWPMFDVPVEIEFRVFFENKRQMLDWDNITVKFYTDGLIGWLIKDDRHDFVRGGHIYTYLDRDAPRMEILIYPAKERLHEFGL